MINGLAVTPVVKGKIRIGEMRVGRNEKRLPQKLDHIVITGQVQRDGEWVEHPAMKKLQEEKAKSKPPKEGAEVKLHSIPVRILFDRVESNLQTQLCCFDRIGRQLCVSGGQTAKRRTIEGVKDVPCPGPEMCEFGKENRCKQYGRMIVALEDEYENDPLAGFMVRTTGFNSINALQSKLNQFHGVTGGKMAGMPCELKIRAKSSAGSMYGVFYHFDLEPVGGLIESFKVAKAYRKKFEDEGLSREGLEEAVSNGLAQSAFFESQEDGVGIVEEFFTNEEDDLPESEHGQGCKPEDIAEIERLMQVTNTPIDNVFTFLGRPTDALQSLTPFEAERIILSMQSLEKVRKTGSVADAGQAQEAKVVVADEAQGKADEVVAFVGPVKPEAPVRRRVRNKPEGSATVEKKHEQKQIPPVIGSGASAQDGTRVGVYF